MGEYQLFDENYKPISDEKYTLDNIDKYLIMDYNINAVYIKYYDVYDLVSDFVYDFMEFFQLENLIQYVIIKNNLKIFMDLCTFYDISLVKNKLYKHMVLLYVYNSVDIFKYCYYQLEVDANILLNGDYIGYPHSHELYKFIYENMNDKIGIMILSRINDYSYDIRFIKFLVNELNITSNDIKRAKLKMNLECLKYCYDVVGLNVDDIREQFIINENNSIEILIWLKNIGYTVDDFRYRDNYILHEVCMINIYDVRFLCEKVGLDYNDFTSRNNTFIETVLSLECANIVKYLVKNVGVERQCFVDYMYNIIDKNIQFNDVDVFLNSVFVF